jgi:hypothetical protein
MGRLRKIGWQCAQQNNNYKHTWDDSVMGAFFAVLNSSRASATEFKLAVMASALLFSAVLLASNAYAQAGADSALVASEQASAALDGDQLLAANIRELDAIVLEKNHLEDLLSTEKGVYEAASLQAASSKKLIRTELDDYFAQSASRDRLDAMLDDFKRETEAENSARLRVASAQKKLNEQQLKFVLADRGVQQLKARLAVEQRERDLQRVKAIAQVLNKTLIFSDSVNFRCSSSKSLATCLNEYDRGANLRQLVMSNYQHALDEALRGQVDSPKLNANWFTYRSKSSFTQAGMELDGGVAAQISFEVNIEAKKIMPCALLGVAEALCDSQSYSLSVRSNKFNDRVLINEQLQGATPLSLMLDKGVYRVQVISDGVRKDRTVNLESDKLLNFKF